MEPEVDKDLNQNIKLEVEPPRMINEQNKPENSLDEPISTTIKRDLMGIATKIKYVFLPSMSKEGASELRNWDLWGPLLLCLLLAITLSLGNSAQGSTVFELVFLIVWIGGIIVTINGQLLGGNMYVYNKINFSKCVHSWVLPVSAEHYINNLCGNEVYPNIVPYSIRDRWIYLVGDMYNSK